MRKIKKIRIPKGERCGKCLFNLEGYCGIFKECTEDNQWIAWRCGDCDKMFPDGAVFELKEIK